MRNPFTDESRDARLSLNIDGFCDKLRAPEALHRLATQHKPKHMSTGDFFLKAALDLRLIELIVAGHYDEVQRTLGTVFGPLGTDGTEWGAPEAPGTGGTTGAARHPKPVAR